VSGPGRAGVPAKPQAAGGTYSKDVEKALYLLGRVYKDVFTFGYDPERGEYWVIRDGDTGTIQWAPAPEELGKLMLGTWGDDL
jgi:hypothetical protein